MLRPRARSSIPFLIATLLLFGGSACRLSSNNGDKLKALQMGESYDEEGLLSVSVASPAADTLINRVSDSADFAVSGSCSPDGVTISLQINDASVSPEKSTACTQGGWTLGLDTTVLSDGEHRLSAMARKDSKTKVSEAVPFRKNTALPSLAITSPTSPSFINASTDSAAFALSGTCGDADQAVSLQVDGASASSQAGGICNGSTWSATISTSGLAAGAHTFTASITSASGNHKSSDPAILTKDVVAPTAAITVPAAASYVNLGNNSASFAVSGTCNDAAASVQVQVDGNSSGSAVSCNGTHWSASISTAALAQGAHTLMARITDPAGNAATSASVAITQDTTAPTVSIGTPAANSFINLSNDSTTFSVSGSCSGATENGRTITLQVDGADATQSTITCGSGSTWAGTIDTTGLAEGAHTMTAILADAASNSTTSSAVNVNRDVTRPSVALTYPVASQVLNAYRVSTALPVKGSCSENGRSVSLQIDGATASNIAGNTCSSGEFSATIDVAGLSNAAHTITATQTDAAGNSGPATAANVSVTQDTSLALGGTFARTSVAYDPYSAAQAASGVARYPTVGGATGILVEESSTNQFTHSNDLTQSVWVQDSFTVASAGTTLAGYPAFLLTCNTTDQYKSVYQIPGTSLTSGQTWTYSVLAKPGTLSVAKIEVHGGTTSINANATFNFSTGVTSTGGDANTSARTARMTALSDGSYLLELTFTVGVTTSGQVFKLYSYNNSVGGTIYYAAPQLEQKAYATTRIVTGASAVTRSAETLSVPTQGSLNANEGAIIIRTYLPPDFSASDKARNLVIHHPDSGNSDTILIGKGGASGIAAANTWRAVTRNGSGQTSEILWSQALTPGWHIFGLRWNSGRLSFYVDGSERGYIATPYRPSAMLSNLYLGSHSTLSGTNWNQPIDYAAFYQHAPTDAEMATFTSTGPVSPDNLLDFHGVGHTRASTATHITTGASAASGVPRYHTISGATGILLEDSTSNILTANQSSVETDLTGFGAQNSYGTLTRDTTQAWQGSASLKFLVGATNDHAALFTTSFTGAAGKAFTLSYWAKADAPCTTAANTATNAGPGIQDSNYSTFTQWPPPVQNITTGWQRFSIGGTVAAGAGDTLRVYLRGCRDTSGNAVAIYYDGIQIEQKAYATSWHVGGGTRAGESVGIPTSGNFNKTAWTLGFDVIPTSTQLSRGSYGRIWAATLDNDNYYLLTVDQSSGRPYIQLKSAGAYCSATGPTVLVAGTKYRIVIRGTGGVISIWQNGVQTSQGDVTCTEPVGSLPALMYLGSVSNTSVNGIIDRMFAFGSAQSDATITGWGTSSAVSNPDFNLDFNQSLGQ